MLSSREVVEGLRTWLGDRNPEDSTPILQQRLVPVYRTRTLLVLLVRLEGENPGRNIIIEIRKKRSREYTMHRNLIFVQIEIFHCIMNAGMQIKRMLPVYNWAGT